MIIKKLHLGWVFPKHALNEMLVILELAYLRVSITTFETFSAQRAMGQIKSLIIGGCLSSCQGVTLSEYTFPYLTRLARFTEERSASIRLCARIGWDHFDIWRPLVSTVLG